MKKLKRSKSKESIACRILSDIDKQARQRGAVVKAERRVLMLAARWAKFFRDFEVLPSPSHHLLRAIDKLEKLTAAS